MAANALFRQHINTEDFAMKPDKSVRREQQRHKARYAPRGVRYATGRPGESLIRWITKRTIKKGKMP